MGTESPPQKMGLIREPAELYHDTKEAISSHGLTEIVLRSPLHYYTKYILEEKKEPSNAMRFGSALHSAMLEPDVFSELMFCEPPVNKRTNVGKEEVQRFYDRLPDNALVITPDEKQMILSMMESLHAHPVAAELLKDGLPEISGYFIRDGLYCKMRPDYIHKNDRIIIDLKSSRDASFKQFQKDIFNYGYHIQTAWYHDGYEDLFGFPCESYIYIVIEKTPPFACAVYVADDTIIERGRSDYLKGVEKYKVCRETGIWQSYQTEAQNISLPYWALYDD